MAKKIEITGSALVKLDTGGGTPEFSEQANETWYDEAELVAGNVKFIRKVFVSESKNEEIYGKPFFLSTAVDKDSTPFTEATFRLFCQTELGKSSAAGGAAAENFNGGLVDYNDLATQSTPITFTAVGEVKLTNDKLGPNTNENFLPTGITSIWNSTTNQFDFTQLKFGDMVDFRLDLIVTTDNPNQNITVDMHLGLTAGEFTIPFISEFQYKSAGTRAVNRFNGIFMGNSNVLDNPAEFRISSDGNGSVVVNGWYCKIIRLG